jgi:aminoglycoside phosphotransferase (APT) family kinase protein
VRWQWAEVPAYVREAIEERLGARVVETSSQIGGQSPGVAERLVLADGRRAFVKAAGPEIHPQTPEMHRREAAVVRLLPAEVPAPRHLFTYDDGAWIALAFENVEGCQPQIPWRADELERVLNALAELADALTPTPVELPSFAAHWQGDFRGLRTLLEAGDTDGLDPWLAANLERLAELEAGWPAASVGETLLHTDIRADNLLLTEDRVLVVDWPDATIGAAWVELVCFLPSVSLQGGPRPWEVFDGHPAARGADPAAVDAMIAALTGLFVERGRREVHPALPALRPFQTAQGIEAARWLERRLG